MPSTNMLFAKFHFYRIQLVVELTILKHLFFFVIFISMLRVNIIVGRSPIAMKFNMSLIKYGATYFRGNSVDK